MLDVVFCISRILWFFVVIIGVTLFVYQVTDRVIVYYQRNTNVDVAIKYVPSVEFPSVTICNQNQFRYKFFPNLQILVFLYLMNNYVVFNFCFRITSTAKRGMYGFINNFFSSANTTGNKFITSFFFSDTKQVKEEFALFYKQLFKHIRREVSQDNEHVLLLCIAKRPTQHRQTHVYLFVKFQIQEVISKGDCTVEKKLSFPLQDIF